MQDRKYINGLQEKTKSNPVNLKKKGFTCEIKKNNKGQ